jgi:arylsulfatase A-like enzyme
LKGFKSSNYEGGVRTPFIVSWPAKFKGGRTVDTPVISLDILPTALDALGVAAPTKNPLDGKSLLPLLTGQTTRHHDVLYWSTGGEGEWSVRQGDWKLHGLKDQVELINLASDPGETTNLAAQHPDKVKELTALYARWLEPMPDHITGGSKDWKASRPAAELDNGRKQERTLRKKERTQQKAASPQVN